MKRAYEKPNIHVAEEKRFEQVYAGACTKNPGNHKDCAWDDNILEGQSHNHSNHTKFDPGYSPDNPSVVS